MREILELQRTAGNAAVSALLLQRLPQEEDPHQSPAETDVGTTAPERPEPGRTLALPVRQDMERRFGRDLSNVRVHTDEGSERQVTAQGADAMTRGSDVSFAPGGYRPETAEGRWLIAHELAHVMQQHGGTEGGLAGPAVLEAQADRAATAVARGWPVPALSAAPALTQHRVAMRDVGRGEQSGSAQIDELVDRLNTISNGVTYAVTDGNLTYTLIEGGAPSEFDRQMMGFIDDATTVPMRFTNRHGRIRDDAGHFTQHVFIDTWQDAYVDIDDLLAASDISLQTSLVHLLRERQVTRNYERRIGSTSLDDTSPEFRRAHESGLDAELPVVRDYFGDPSIRFIDKQNRVYRNARGDTLREHTTVRHGAGEGIEALDIRVTLHDTHRVITAEEYRALLQAERAAP
jgi:hypothetical protein